VDLLCTWYPTLTLNFRATAIVFLIAALLFSLDSVAGTNFYAKFWGDEDRILKPCVGPSETGLAKVGKENEQLVEIEVTHETSFQRTPLELTEIKARTASQLLSELLAQLWSEIKELVKKIATDLANGKLDLFITLCFGAVIGIFFMIWKRFARQDEGGLELDDEYPVADSDTHVAMATPASIAAADTGDEEDTLSSEGVGAPHYRQPLESPIPSLQASASIATPVTTLESSEIANLKLEIATLKSQDDQGRLGSLATNAATPAKSSARQVAKLEPHAPAKLKEYHERDDRDEHIAVSAVNTTEPAAHVASPHVDTRRTLKSRSNSSPRSLPLSTPDSRCDTSNDCESRKSSTRKDQKRGIEDLETSSSDNEADAARPRNRPRQDVEANAMDESHMPDGEDDPDTPDAYQGEDIFAGDAGSQDHNDESDRDTNRGVGVGDSTVGRIAETLGGEE
jgi:hypothetical protein